MVEKKKVNEIIWCILDCCNSLFYKFSLLVQQIGFVTRKNEVINPLFKSVSHFNQIGVEIGREVKLKEQVLEKKICMRISPTELLFFLPDHNLCFSGASHPCSFPASIIYHNIVSHDIMLISCRKRSISFFAIKNQG